MNTAARIESTGLPGKIHVSDVTADLLKQKDKGKWLIPRSGRIELSGKGDMHTYWLRTGTRNQMRSSTDITPIEEEGSESEAEFEFEIADCNVLHLNKTERLVEWNTEILCQLLQQVVACRTSSSLPFAATSKLEMVIGHGQTVLEEFNEIIVMPKYSPKALQQRRDPSTIVLSPAVVHQVREYVANVGKMYHESNSFHNFEHASHVAASVRKLLTRIVNCDANGCQFGSGVGLVDRGGHSYGITSDPMVQFAVVLSAIIHDAGKCFPT